MQIYFDCLLSNVFAETKSNRSPLIFGSLCIIPIVISKLIKFIRFTKGRFVNRKVKLYRLIVLSGFLCSKIHFSMGRSVSDKKTRQSGVILAYLDTVGNRL